MRAIIDTENRAVILLPALLANDAMTIQGRCAHGYKLAGPNRCWACEPCTHMGADFRACDCQCGPDDPALIVPLVECGNCGDLTYFLFPVESADPSVGFREDAMVCETCFGKMGGGK